MANVPNDFINTQPVEGAVRSEQAIDVNPAAFGAGVGGAMRQAGAEAQEGAYRIIERDNYIKVERARSQFMAAVDAKSQDLMSKRGEDAANTPKELNQFIGQQRQQVLQGLTGRQQNLFDLDTLRYARFAQNGMDRWAREQSGIAEQTAAVRGVAGAAIGMRQAVTSEDFQFRRGMLNKYAKDYTGLMGMSPDAAEEYRFSKMSDALMGTVNALRNSDPPKPAEAARILQEYGKEIDPAAHGYGAYQKQLAKEDIELRSKKVSGEIWTNFSGQNSQPDIKSMYEEANTTAPEIRDQVVGRIKKAEEEYKQGLQVDNATGRMNYGQDLSDYSEDQKRLIGDRKGVLNPREQNAAWQRNRGYPAELIESLQEAQVKVEDKEVKAEDVNPLSDSIAAKIGALNPHAPVERFNTEHQAIVDDLNKLTALGSMGRASAVILRGELTRAVVESKKLPEDQHDFFYGSAKTPGFRADMWTALKAANTGGLLWGSPPLSSEDLVAVWGGINKIAMDYMKAHPEAPSTEVAEEMDKNPIIANAKQKATLSEAFRELSERGGVKATDKFNPSEFENK